MSHKWKLFFSNYLTLRSNLTLTASTVTSLTALNARWENVVTFISLLHLEGMKAKAPGFLHYRVLLRGNTSRSMLPN